MFLAWRDMLFARTRFLLMGLVLALMSILIVIISGLTAGLVNDGVSGLKAMGEEGAEVAARITGRQGRRTTAELLDAVGMSHRAGHRPASLSGGERQPIGIARALVGNPQLLLVDEPTAALDRQRAQEIVSLLARECHDYGVAGVMVTHDLGVLEHCDRVLDMVDGRLG